jgi:hypothetical protein
MENQNFLQEKYPDMPGSKPVERAVDRARDSGEKIRDNTDRVDAYMDRLNEISSKERGFDLLKNKILNSFTLAVDDEEKLIKLAEGLYESEKRLLVEQGRGGDIQKLGSEKEILEHYKPLIREKAEIQRKTLSSWLEYLQKNDAKHPMWFRYFVVRSLEKMGTFNKEKADYAKRTPTTVAPFPELNSEALGWVYKKFTENLGDIQDFDPQDPDAEQKKKALEKMVKKKDFAKLYAFALIETAGRLNRESIEGDWKKYNQGGDWHVLEQELKGKGTGWCTAEGSAKAHLEGGDFYVYYTKGSDGAYTEPRIAIRMDGGQLGEVRGVNYRQELEPDLVDIAQEKYHNLPGGEAYDKKAGDMKKVTKLAKKQEKGESFTKDELIFLYEIDSPIEGFGYDYDRDPRIKELRDQRKMSLKEDAAIVLECAPDEIAWKQGDINKKTKAYIGSLFKGIFQKGLENIYTSFPEGRIEKANMEIGGKTEAELEKEIKNKKDDQGRNYQIYQYAESMMRNPDFTVAKNPEQIDLVRLKVRDLGFTKNPTTDEIYKKAEEFGLELCPAETGPHLRLKYKEVFKREQPMNEYLYTAMKQVPDSSGDLRVFSVYRSGGGFWLDDGWAESGSEWSLGSEFVFRLRKTED